MNPLPAEKPSGETLFDRGLPSFNNVLCTPPLGASCNKGNIGPSESPMELAFPPVPSKPSIPLLLEGFRSPGHQISKEQFRKAEEIPLHAEPCSPEAKKFIQHIRSLVQGWEFAHGNRKKGRREKGLQKLDRAIGTILAGLLCAWSCTSPKASYGSLKKDRFSGTPVGARSYIRAIAALRGLAFVHHQEGYRKHQNDSFAGRDWPSQQLLTLAVAYGITAETVRQHFKFPAPTKPPRIASPLRLKAMRRAGQGRSVALDIDENDPVAKMLREEVRAMNCLAERTNVEGSAPPRWFRSFTQDWQHHGRWYAAGEGSYQQKPEEERLQITIGGEAVVEIDISASHLTLLHGICGLRAPLVDGYAIDGVPREVAKAWINATIGKGSPVRRWSKKALEESSTLASFPAREVGQAVLRRYPFLADPAAALKESVSNTDRRRLLPLRLMFIESAILSETMQRLASRNILSLPMHDGLIVPKSAEHEAKAMLLDAGQAIGGVVFRLKVSPAPDDSTSLEASIG